MGAYFGIFLCLFQNFYAFFSRFWVCLSFLGFLLPFPCPIPEFFGSQIPNFPRRCLRTSPGRRGAPRCRCSGWAGPWISRTPSWVSPPKIQPGSQNLPSHPKNPAGIPEFAFSHPKIPFSIPQIHPQIPKFGFFLSHSRGG